jgi:hypothetical protein
MSSYVAVGKLYTTVGTAGELYIAGEVCGSGKLWLGFGIRPGVGAGVPVAHRTLWQLARCGSW